MNAPNVGPEMLLDVNTTAAAAASSMRGITTTALAAAPTASGRVVYMGAGFRGFTLRIFGVGADNAAGTFKVWRRRRVTPSAPGGDRGLAGVTTPAIDRVLVGTGTFTLSTTTTVPTGTGIPFPASNFFADGMTFTVDTEFLRLCQTVGGEGSAGDGSMNVGVYSPADNGTSGIAMLTVADLFDAEAFEVELVKGTATSVNGVVDLTR